jgi:hypothetical protein
VNVLRFIWDIFWANILVLILTVGIPLLFITAVGLGIWGLLVHW